MREVSSRKTHRYFVIGNQCIFPLRKTQVHSSMLLMLTHYLLLGLGGVLGTFLRYWMVIIIPNMGIGGSSLYSITLINWLGSFLFTFLFTWLGSHTQIEASSNLRVFLFVGFLGSFTTFSTFSFEALGFLQKKAVNQAFLYIMASVGGSLLLAWLGWHWGSYLSR